MSASRRLHDVSGRPMGAPYTEVNTKVATGPNTSSR